jgi:hypothetical protein
MGFGAGLTHGFLTYIFRTHRSLRRSPRIPLTGCRLHRRPQTFLAHDRLQGGFARYEVHGAGVFGLQHDPSEKAHDTCAPEALLFTVGSRRALHSYGGN